MLKLHVAYVNYVPIKHQDVHDQCEQKCLQDDRCKSISLFGSKCFFHEESSQTASDLDLFVAAERQGQGEVKQMAIYYECKLDDYNFL